MYAHACTRGLHLSYICKSFFFLLAPPPGHNRLTTNFVPVKVLGTPVIQRGVKSYGGASLGSMQTMPFPLMDLSILFGIQGNLGSGPRDTQMTVLEIVYNLTMSSKTDTACLAASISQHCGSHTSPALGCAHSIWFIFRSSHTRATELLGTDSRQAKVCHDPFTHSSSQLMSSQTTPVNTHRSFQTGRKSRLGEGVKLADQ